jgi:hypothetical protein
LIFKLTPDLILLGPSEGLLTGRCEEWCCFAVGGRSEGLVRARGVVVDSCVGAKQGLFLAFGVFNETESGRKRRLPDARRVLFVTEAP